jgi:hypothetical protein
VDRPPFPGQGEVAAWIRRDLNDGPGRPAGLDRAGALRSTMTHDYIRHGTTTLLAALNILDGTVLGQCMPRHRAQQASRSD